nr:Unknown (protein for MGC:167444) [synthetic construct]
MERQKRKEPGIRL